MERTFEQFTLLVLKINKLIQRIKTFEIRGYGLKAVHVLCVYFLNENPQGLTAAEIVKLTVEDKAAIRARLPSLKARALPTAGGMGATLSLRLPKAVRRWLNLLTVKLLRRKRLAILIFPTKKGKFFIIR